MFVAKYEKRTVVVFTNSKHSLPINFFFFFTQLMRSHSQASKFGRVVTDFLVMVNQKKQLMVTLISTGPETHVPIQASLLMKLCYAII